MDDKIQTRLKNIFIEYQALPPEMKKEMSLYDYSRLTYSGQEPTFPGRNLKGWLKAKFEKKEQIIIEISMGDKIESRNGFVAGYDSRYNIMLKDSNGKEKIYLNNNIISLSQAKIPKKRSKNANPSKVDCSQ